MSDCRDLEVLSKQDLLAVTQTDEEELHHQRNQQNMIITPELKDQSEVYISDVQQLKAIQKEWSPGLERKDTKPWHFEKEQEDLWSCQEEAEAEEADISMLPFTVVIVKNEDDEKEPQFLQFQHSHPERTGTEADCEDCERSEEASNSDLEGYLQPEMKVKTEDSSESETKDRDDKCKTTRDVQPGLKTLENTEEMTPKMSKKPLSCSQCGKTFTRNGYMTKHMRTHTGEKPFSCSMCGKRFAQKNYVTQHMITHTGEKPFSCSMCGKKFSQKNHVTQHMILHIGETPFSCSLCDKRFALKYRLTQHMIIHTGVKPFSCSLCDKKFAQKGCLNRHMTRHTGDKPYTCSTCEKRFSQKAHLVEHMIIHTGEKRFSCSVCGKRYTHKENVRKHMAHHKEEKPFIIQSTGA
ncbi:LOW QUALITY PROTEIN: zinc finger protein 41-like [Xyrichtys novacula]|uniref:LOW QUALITY PROTEIN: zinc finger protein 41-like n=1 Tax=Xyrichtys novacula TaxID=13765 RepID=A0AAV1HBW6_XYRNO|nr:LOW QUALITY PROTEIN: zinc finger protein 41-like [Xyrichtys novacula]